LQDAHYPVLGVFLELGLAPRHKVNVLSLNGGGMEVPWAG